LLIQCKSSSGGYWVQAGPGFDDEKKLLIRADACMVAC